ncbi:Xylose operon regulatory protein [Rubripirellula lacrimiformis]|uniref:Xylose operon regulatory protein n=1 Tax=Rubripirellula lacrimiformis TaxID=1930273 RepID=A0A517NJ04_9BACT|nr:XylR family transcriptional regulator [Rubripirellula lacrimiformis]QDT07112.1 Xylose operon regulatory protein [Rubripirellula lacrimiformis]
MKETIRGKSTGLPREGDRPNVLLIVETAMSFGRGVLEGISRYMVEAPSWSVQLDLRELLVSPPAWLRRWDGDGIITRSTTPEMADIILKWGIPTVNLTDIYGDQGIPAIWNDHAAIGRMAAEHLIERGLTNFAFCGFSDHHWSTERRIGFSAAVGERGHQAHCHASDWSQARRSGWEKQQAKIVEWLQSLPKPIGIMACNDFRGQHVLEACRSARLSIPDQVAVIGVDNDQVICDFCQPQLSSVVPAAERIGYEAAALLDRLMHGEKPARTIRLVQPLGVASRHSTDVMAIEDKEVVMALKIIRERACLGLTVQEILREVPIARSSLERRFRRSIGRSPQAEIRDVQMKRARQLLCDTDLSLAQISSLTGFKHSEYFSVVFKREIGQTPGQFRSSVG